MKFEILMTAISITSLCISIFALRMRKVELGAIEKIMRHSVEDKQRDTMIHSGLKDRRESVEGRVKQIRSDVAELENRINVGEDGYWKDKLDKTITVREVIKLINGR